MIVYLPASASSANDFAINPIDLTNAEPVKRLVRMRLIATAALLAVFCLMIVARLLERQNPTWSWMRAFCEAATVGALADWFAVVALFRHPLGLPIPHTAILPRSKDRVAETLATFIETSFLTEERLRPRFCEIDYAGLAARWLRKHADYLASQAALHLPGILAGFDDREIAGLLRQRVQAMVVNTELGPLAGAGLSVIVQDGRDRAIFNSTLNLAGNFVLQNRGIIREKIREEIPLSSEILRKAPVLQNLAGPLLDQITDFLAGLVADKTIEKVQAILDEARQSHDHPLWQVFDERLRAFIDDLRGSPEMAAKICAMQEAIGKSPVLDEFATRAWTEMKAFLLRDCSAEESTVRTKLHEAVLSIARQLETNESTRQEINPFIGEQVIKSFLAARPYAREFMTSTVAKWDAAEMSNRIEAAVGSDLQFIRLNGTFIGGLMGLAIHAGFVLLAR